MKLNIRYNLNDVENTLTANLERELSKQDDNLGYFAQIDNGSIKIKIYPKKELTFKEISVFLPVGLTSSDRIYFNGYSDWTYSYESDFNTINYGLSKVPFGKFTINKFHLDRYGDYNFADYPVKNGYNHGWTYLYIRNNDVYKFYGSLNDDFAFTRFVFEKEKGITIIPDLNGYTTSESFTAIDVCYLTGDENSVYDEYFKLLNIEKPTASKMVGYTSWYNHYQKISEDIIINDLNGLDSLDEKVDMFQIDDGYEAFVGDWLDVDPKKFKNGLKGTVDNIHSKGYKAGLWLAPFSAETNSRLYKEHPEYFLRDDKGDIVAAGSNWSGFYALDIYKVEVRQYLKKVFDTIFNEWGFDLVKLDFLYSACIYPRPDKPRGKVMADGMNFLRQLCKDKLILGCGVPCASGFGRVDYCRIGPDVSLDYDDKFYMQHLHNERNSTKHTMVNTIFRRGLDGRAFLNDPDVFILRDNNVKLTEKQKEQLAYINGLFGSVLFMSDDASKYDDNKKEIYKKVINLKDKCTKVEVNDNKVIVSYEYDGNSEEIVIEL